MRLRDTQYLFSPAKNYEKITTCLTSPDMIRYMLYFTFIESPLQKTDEQGQEMSAPLRTCRISISTNPVSSR